jgi:hypothetical protein
LSDWDQSAAPEKISDQNTQDLATAASKSAAQGRDDALREIEEEPERILTEYKRRFGNVLGKTMLVEEMNLPNSPNPAAPNCGVVAAEELSVGLRWKRMLYV